jgi:hypothetical protein
MSGEDEIEFLVNWLSASSLVELVLEDASELLGTLEFLKILPEIL